jgi:hypothetical protein
MTIKLRTLALCLLLPRALIAETKQPNIVMIIVDDLGWRDLSC